MNNIQVAAPADPGGTKAFEGPLHVGRPNIGGHTRTLNGIRQVLARRWLTNNGPFVQEFEGCIATFVTAKHCAAMYNVTGALEITIRAAALRHEVILPAFTFGAKTHALQWPKITPVFSDIDLKRPRPRPTRMPDLGRGSRPQAGLKSCAVVFDPQPVGSPVGRPLREPLQHGTEKRH
jgi:hypothetical protein